MNFFERQVVLLTGSTGGLGGCLLYKLSVVLHVPRIYILVRKTPEEAIKKWSLTMPAQVGEMLSTGSIHFLSGDVTRPRFGLNSNELDTLEKEVTIIINAAANISLKAPLQKVVRDNCLSALELGHMATQFAALTNFVQVSSAYALSDLPDGPMEEKIYSVGDAEQILEDVLAGKTSDWAGFAWPYAKSKRLMECLLSQRYSHRLPLLIIRPTGLGPAIKEPAEMYGPIGSCPVSNWLSQMMLPTGGTAVFPAKKGSSSGSSVFDEIPVDLAANIILQHVVRGTRGVVHTSSQSYVPKTFDDFLADLDRYVPGYWKANMPKVIFTSDPQAQLSRIAKFFIICNRDWLVRAGRSLFLEHEGPIGVDFPDHDIVQFTEKRIMKIFKETRTLLAEKELRNTIVPTIQTKL